MQDLTETNLFFGALGAAVFAIFVSFFGHNVHAWMMTHEVPQAIASLVMNGGAGVL